MFRGWDLTADEGAMKAWPRCLHGPYSDASLQLNRGEFHALANEFHKLHETHVTLRHRHSTGPGAPAIQPDIEALRNRLVL